MSSAASMPTDTRIVPGPTPSSARSAGLRPRCEVISGYGIVVSTRPWLAASVTLRQPHLPRRRALERGVIDAGDPRHPEQGTSEGDAVVAVPAHAQVQGPQAAQREPGVERP